MPQLQCSFRMGRSAMNIFAAKQLMEKSKEQHRDVYLTSVDLSKAFDSVDRAPLESPREVWVPT